LETRDVIQREPEDGQPVGKAIASECTECEKLVQAWAEPSFSEQTVEIMRNLLKGTARSERSRGPEDFRKRQSAGSENLQNFVRQA
jgi:hypothetical protein